MTAVGRFALGLAAGSLLAGSVLWFSGSEDSEPVATTLASVAASIPATTTAPFVEEGEAVFGSAVLLPRGLAVEDAVATLDYDLAGLSPSLMTGDDQEYDGDVLMMPELWELTTVAGVVIEETTGIGDSSVRFELPSGEDAVDRVELVGWRVATTFGERLELEIIEGETGSFRSGQVTIETVLEQSISTIVQIDFDATGDDWGGGWLRPVDGGWRVSGRQGGGIQLIWEGTDAPAQVVLEDVGFEMRPRSGRVVVIDQGGD